MSPESLKKWRTSQGFTQTQAAEVFGVKLCQYYRWETGKVKIPRYTALIAECWEYAKTKIDC